MPATPSNVHFRAQVLDFRATVSTDGSVVSTLNIRLFVPLGFRSAGGDVVVPGFWTYQQCQQRVDQG